MERYKTKRVLMLGDSGVGKSTLLSQMFDQLYSNSFLPTSVSEQQKSTIGCMVHVHYLNPLFKELEDHPFDHFLEFHDLSGPFKDNADVAKAFIAQKYDGLIITIDLNNLQSLNTLH